MIKRSFLAVVLILSLAILVASVPSTVLSSVPVVNYTYPKAVQYANSVKCSGTIEMQSFKEIYASTPLMADVVWVAQGDYVHKGDVLATIDREITQTMAKSQGPLGITLPAGTPTDLPEDLSAYADIAKSFGIPLEQLEIAMAAYGSKDSAQALPVDSYTIDEIPQEILAPASGVITGVGMRQGVLMRTGNAAFIIGDSSSFIALLNVREADIAQISVGNTVKLSGNGMGDTVYNGYVRRIYPVAKTQGLAGSSAERIVNIEVEIIDPDARLKHGFTTLADISTEAPRDIIIVPYEAVGQDDNNNEYVYVYTNGVIAKRFIQTGLEASTGVEVISGLNSREIVLTNAATLQEGQRVRLKRLVNLYG